jgi:Fic family protein
VTLATLPAFAVVNARQMIATVKILPLAIPQQLEQFFDQVLSKATEISDPFEQAFFAMVHLPYLQPFEDVNKRVSRLAANIPFIKHNLSPLSFLDVSERTTSKARSPCTS